MITIELKNVVSVYSGKKGTCCCGCAGKHTYATVHRQWAGTDRGYTVALDECNDRTVKLIVKKVEKAEHVDILSDCISAEIGNRLYVVYLNPGRRTIYFKEGDHIA